MYEYCIKQRIATIYKILHAYAFDVSEAAVVRGIQSETSWQTLLLDRERQKPKQPKLSFLGDYYILLNNEGAHNPNIAGMGPAAFEKVS